MRALALFLILVAITPDNKAAQHAAEQQRKALEHEMHQQQEFEKRVMQEQQRAVHEQRKAQQRYVEQQQRAMIEQQKRYQQEMQRANQQQERQNQVKPAVAGQPQGQIQAQVHPSTPIYHASRAYYGHHYYGHPRSRFVSYQNHRVWPTQQNSQTAALNRLKHSLDAVRHNQVVTASERTSIKNGLMGVVEVSRIPTLVSVEKLSNHLAEGLATREAATAQTSQMALTLRGMLNSTALSRADLNEIVAEHRQALTASKVRPTEATAIIESLRTITNHERNIH